MLLFFTAKRPKLPLLTYKHQQIFSISTSVSAIQIPHLSRATITTMPPLKSWLPIPPKSDFSLSNIPFGIITSRNSRDQHRPATVIGTHVLDLLAFSKGNGFSKLSSITPHLSVFEQPTLNSFAALGQTVHKEVRAYIQEIFKEDGKYPEILRDNEDLRKEALLVKEDTKNHLPMQIGDYSDFFAGRNHAQNLGYLSLSPPLFAPFQKHIPSQLTNEFGVQFHVPRSQKRPPTKLQLPPRRLPRPRLQCRSFRNPHNATPRPNSPRPLPTHLSHIQSKSKPRHRTRTSLFPLYSKHLGSSYKNIRSKKPYFRICINE